MASEGRGGVGNGGVGTESGSWECTGSGKSVRKEMWMGVSWDHSMAEDQQGVSGLLKRYILQLIETWLFPPK